MNQTLLECPSIHVALGAGVDPDLYRWVVIGAEEEGVPCLRVGSVTGEAVAQAFAAAQSSRLSIGVGLDAAKVALHEQHMPPEQPVLVFALATDPVAACRRMGANAARMVIRRPLLLTAAAPVVVEGTPVTVPGSAAAPLLEPNAMALAQVTVMIIRKLRERGLL